MATGEFGDGKAMASIDNSKDSDFGVEKGWLEATSFGKGGLWGDLAGNLGDILGGFVGASGVEGVMGSNITQPALVNVGGQGMNSVQVGNQAFG